MLCLLSQAFKSDAAGVPLRQALFLSEVRPHGAQAGFTHPHQE